MVKDVLIVGSGIAGLNLACQLAVLRPDMQIALICHSHLANSNSNKAQGGVAISKNDEKSLSAHIQDTHKAGDYFGDIQIIGDILKDAPNILEYLKIYGLEFDEATNGNLSLTIEGGHSEPRIIHIKDFTGEAIISAMIQLAKSFKNIQIQEQTDVIQILTNKNNKENSSINVLMVDVETLKTSSINAKNVVIATGGIGALYLQTTNSSNSNANGIYLALNAGLEIRDLEFIQFHPTALYSDGDENLELISEAVRGEGAILVNDKSERFMKKYNSNLELAPRDIVSRAIFFELIKTNSKCVYLDAKKLNTTSFKNRFPSIFKKCLEKGINPELEKIPVIPAQHFHCGGIATDTFGRTSINNIYAVGECAATGLHGANRLASNSLLECIIVSNRIAKDIANQNFVDSHLESKIPYLFTFIKASSLECQVLERINHEMRTIMTQEVGIICTNNGLNSALEEIKILQNKIAAFIDGKSIAWEAFKLYRKVLVSKQIIQAAITRTKNVGTFFNINLDENYSSKIDQFTPDKIQL